MSNDNIAVIRNGTIEYATVKQSSDDLTELSIQKRILPDERSNIFPSVMHFAYSGDPDRSALPSWWSEYRDIELRRFWMRPGNDILQGAISSMIKKFKSMNWVIEGPQRVVNRYQKVLTTAEFGQGWVFLLGKMLNDYLTQDKGAFWEILGNGDLSGPIEGPVMGIANLDSRFCQLTGDIEFPVIFNNPKTENQHKLHFTRVAHFVDMPSPAENMNNTGFCAVSRVVGSSEILLKINKYKNEKLDDMPEAGLLVFNNVLPQQWNDAKADYQVQNRRLGHEHWRNLMTFFSLDPAARAEVNLTSFADLPDAFDELQSTNIYLNIVALSFGVDTREFWPITGGSLGTATESEVMHQKARGKGVGEIISTVERIINWKILPESVTFSFDFKDDQEDLLSADIDDKRATTIMNMWNNGNGPITEIEARQMLADNVSYFKDDFLQFDATLEEEATDTEIAKSFGPLCRADNKGNIQRIPRRTKMKPLITDAISLAAENYEKGLITAETVAEFALGELITNER